MSSSEIEEVLQRWKDLEVSKVMSDAKKKNGLDKFLIVKTLLSKCCAEVMRTLVIETAKRNEPPKDHTGHWSLDRFLRQYKNRIERRIHTIDKLGRPMDILFPRKGKTKLDEWDESLLSFILLNVCFLDEHMADNVADIRKVRNETSHSSKALNMTDSQYESYLERLKRSIKACLDFIDNRDLSSFINAQVSEIEFDEVDENEKMRRLQSIYQKDKEDHEKLKNASEVYERMENELSEIVKKFKGIEMPEHQLELVIKNSSQELEKKLSKCIVEKINELVKSKKRLPSSSENDDDIEMTIAVANLLEKWKSKGWVITEAIKGSVLLNIRCSTFDDVCYMYNTHKGEGSNMHVSDLQTALQEVIGLDVKLSLVMHDCEMETFMEKIVSSLLSRSKALTSLNTNGDRNDTKVRLYMKRCLPNVPTLTDVDLKELDGHLRRIAEVLEKKNDLSSVSLHFCEEEMQSEVKADLQIGESMQMTGQLNPILDRLDLEMDSLDSNKQTIEMETGWPHGLIEEKEKMETVQDLSEEPEPHTTRYEHLDLYEKMFGMEFTSNNMKMFEMKSDKTDGQADVPDVAKGHECRTISNSHCSSSSETESTYNSSAEERGGLMNKPYRNWFCEDALEGIKGLTDEIVQKMHDSRTMEQSVEERFDRITSILEDDKDLNVRLDTQQTARSVKMHNIDIEGQIVKLDTMCHHREEGKEYLIRKQDKAQNDYSCKHDKENNAKLIESRLDSWKSIPINIAVIGQSGIGKSSFINAVRGICKDNVGAAQVGEKETTSKYCSYTHPRHDRFILWDLPGVGTDKFPQKTYMESIHASRYDFFLIVSSGRFHSQDIWLANEVLKQKHKSRCYFVRSKVDIDMKNRKRRHALEKGTMTDADLFLNFRAEMISDILKTLHNPKIKIHLFLVSSHFPSKYDFEDLQLRLLEDALNIKRLSLTFGMTGLTKRLMDHKRNALRLRQREIALLSCKSENTNAEVVFPCSIMHIQSEIKFYKEQLSLNTEGLDYAASAVGLKSSDLRKKVEMKSVPAMSIDSLIKSLNELYRSTYANQSYLTKQWRYYIRYDMVALKTIETFLQGQLDQAMRDTENLIDFITNMKESSVV